MKLPAADLFKQLLGPSFVDINQPHLSLGRPGPTAAQCPTPVHSSLQPLHWPTSRLWSGFFALADAAYLDGPSFSPAKQSAMPQACDLPVTSLRDGFGAIPGLLALNTALGVCLSIRPWLDEAIALEQQAAETGQEPSHRAPWPEVVMGLQDGARWFVREWLIKFVVKPRLEEAAIASLPVNEARKLLLPLRPHLEILREISAKLPLHRRLASLLEGALYSGALLKAADLVYTTVMLGYACWAMEKDRRPPVGWYLRELRAALLRCSITWGVAAAFAASFALVDEWPLKASLGHFAGETLAGMFLYPLVLQSVGYT